MRRTLLAWSAFASAAVLVPAAVFATAFSANAAPLSVQYREDTRQPGVFVGEYTIRNTADAAVTGWKLEFDLEGAEVGAFWNALMTRQGDHYVFTAREFNGTIPKGGQVTFGFVGHGAGQPLNCELNDRPCDEAVGGEPTSAPSPLPTGAPPASPGVPAPSASPAPTASEPPAAPNPPAGGSAKAAPYVDTGVLSNGRLGSLADLSRATGVKEFTLAFVTASGCGPRWPVEEDFVKQQIDGLRAVGGDVRVSFGGAQGVELAQACPDVNSLVQAYDSVIRKFDVDYVDMDVEGAAAAQPDSIDRRSEALAELQRRHPGLKVSLTLPVLPTGLTDGVGVVRSAKENGVQVDVVNIMAMDYGIAGDRGDQAVQAARSTLGQLKEIYGASASFRMVGVTPMVGQDDQGQVFDLADADQLVAFARQNGIGLLSFWAVTRDKGCQDALFLCSRIQQDDLAFSKKFATFR